MKNKYSIIAIAAVAFSLVSCDKFLDVMPDNRTELDTQEAILLFGNRGCQSGNRGHH